MLGYVHLDISVQWEIGVVCLSVKHWSFKLLPVINGLKVYIWTTGKYCMLVYEHMHGIHKVLAFRNAGIERTCNQCGSWLSLPINSATSLKLHQKPIIMLSFGTMWRLAVIKRLCYNEFLFCRWMDCEIHVLTVYDQNSCYNEMSCNEHMV